MYTTAEERRGEGEGRVAVSFLLAAGSPAVSAPAHTATYCAPQHLNYSHAHVHYRELQPGCICLCALCLYACLYFYANVYICGHVQVVSIILCGCTCIPGACMCAHMQTRLWSSALEQSLQDALNPIDVNSYRQGALNYSTDPLPCFSFISTSPL